MLKKRALLSSKSSGSINQPPNIIRLTSKQNQELLNSSEREEDTQRGSGSHAVHDILLKQQPWKANVDLMDHISIGTTVQCKCGASSWYPARVIEVNREQDNPGCMSVRLRRVGFTAQNDMRVPCIPSRIQPQIVLRHTKGAFCKVDDFVRVVSTDADEYPYFKANGILPVGRVLAVMPQRDMVRVSLTKLRRCQEEHFCLAVVEVIEEIMYQEWRARILGQRLHDQLVAAAARRQQTPEIVWVEDISISGRCVTITLNDCGSHVVAKLDQNGSTIGSHEIPNDFCCSAGFQSLEWTSDKEKEQLYLHILASFHCDHGELSFVAGDFTPYCSNATKILAEFDAIIDGKGHARH